MKITAAPFLCFITALLGAGAAGAQVSWQNADHAFGNLPDGFHVYSSSGSPDEKPFRAFYAIAELSRPELYFTTDTTQGRRLAPSGFYAKNNSPLLVVNSTFFSFATNRNLNLVIRNGRIAAFNVHSVPGKGKDSLTYRHTFSGAMGISKKRKADIAWVYTDSAARYAYASQHVPGQYKDSSGKTTLKKVKNQFAGTGVKFKKWKMQAAVAGGPVLLQDGQIKISNNEEHRFNGTAISDRHPRTLMGYTKDNKLIVMVVEGRNPGIADGISLIQAAQLLKALGCVEALNLDGGGSSCMLINGRETIRPSDKAVQRPVPAVFIIGSKVL